MGTKVCILLLFLIGWTDGNLDDVVKPVLENASKITGRLLSMTVGGVTAFPLEIVRMLNFNGGIPTLINNRNIVNFMKNFSVNYELGKKNEDVNLNATSLLLKYGKSVEEHELMTEDGYILTLFRVPGKGQPIFLMHGLIGSAEDFILAGPEDGLVYILSNAGYDVWLGNARGNKYSRKHVKLTPDNSKFWDFSWNEIGTHDLPAMIDYVLDYTGYNKLKYIGHSQGTTSFFVMASEKPENNKKVSLMVGLSPVAFMSHAVSPVVRLLSVPGPLFHSVTAALGLHEFMMDNKLSSILGQVMCGLNNLATLMCSNALFFVVGFDFEQLDAAKLPLLLSHYPSGASVKQFVHYGQGVVSGKFRKFDYGARENIKRYGQPFPPEYALEKISAPVSLFYSTSDWLAHPNDVDTLYQRLENAIDIYKIPHKEFNHIDFLFGKDVKALVYKRLMKLISQFKKG